MKKVFYVKGLSCKKCKARILNSLQTLPEINSIKIKVDSGKVTIDSNSEISEQVLAEKVSQAGESYSYTNEKPELLKVIKKKIKKYYPLVTILIGVALASYLITLFAGGFELHTFMRFFMAFFFLFFGGLKFLNPDKFRETFALYDPLASRFISYKMFYPFIEIILGLIYLLNIFPLLIPNLVTIFILSVTSFGIFIALKNDKELQCACLGGFFSIPISWLTVFENLLMIGMAFFMLVPVQSMEHPYYEKLQARHEAMMSGESMDMGMGKGAQKKVIAVLLYDQFALLDATGPMQVLGALDNYEIVTVAKNKGTVSADNGVKIVIDKTFAELDIADILVIPGGLFGTIAASKDKDTLDWIKKINQTTTFTTSVCTGAWILGAAGLLEGKQASTHWSGKDYLERFGAEYTGKRFTEDGKILTAAGVSAGIDMALHLQAKIEGDDAAKVNELIMEYDPQPPFDSGTPKKADPVLVKIIDKMEQDHIQMADHMK